MATLQATTIGKLLASTRPEEIRQGLALAKEEIPKATSPERDALLEMLSALFYIDALEQPDLIP